MHKICDRVGGFEPGTPLQQPNRNTHCTMVQAIVHS